MGTCEYCGHPAGILRSKHRECEERFRSTRQQLVRQIAAAILNRERYPSIEAAAKPIAREGFVRGDEFRKVMQEAWVRALEEALDDRVLSDAEQTALLEFSQASGMDGAIRALPEFSKLAKAAVLRELSNGIVSSRVRFSGVMPNLQRDETLVWAFPGTEYLEDRTRREYVGRSQGVSVRIMKGVTYRVGSFKGQPVDRQERVSVDTGTLFVTDKHLYFSSDQKSFRVPYLKIVSFNHYTDGLGIMRDAASAKPQIFRVDDGWFLCNMVGLLASR